MGSEMCIRDSSFSRLPSLRTPLGRTAARGWRGNGASPFEDLGTESASIVVPTPCEMERCVIATRGVRPSRRLGKLLRCCTRALQGAAALGMCVVTCAVDEASGATAHELGLPTVLTPAVDGRNCAVAASALP